MRYSKALLLYVVVPAITVLALRTYTIGWAVTSFKFGCDTATLRVKKIYGDAAGSDFGRFCTAYTAGIEKEFRLLP